MDATVLLCDYAEEVGGKLYIMGGGWSQLVRPFAPTTMCLAIKLSIPLEEAEAVHKIRAELASSAGETVTIEGKPVRVVGEIRSTRELRSSQAPVPNANLVLRFDGLELAPGQYSWHFEVDDQRLATIPFGVPEGEEAAASEV